MHTESTADVYDKAKDTLMEWLDGTYTYDNQAYRLVSENPLVFRVGERDFEIRLFVHGVTGA